MNVYDKALLALKALDRDSIKEPRPYQEYVISTDTHVLLRVNKSKCEGEYKEHKNQPDYGKVIPYETCNIKFPVSALRNVLKKYYKENEKTGQDQIECEECCGRGYVRWRYTDSFGDSHYENFDCPICEGEGFIYKYEGLENYRNISINDIWFSIKNLKKINDIFEILGIRNVEITHLKENRPMRIKVEEGVDIIAMPNRVSEPIEKIKLKV